MILFIQHFFLGGEHLPSLPSSPAAAAPAAALFFTRRESGAASSLHVTISSQPEVDGFATEIRQPAAGKRRSQPQLGDTRERSLSLSPRGCEGDGNIEFR